MEIGDLLREYDLFSYLLGAACAHISDMQKAELFPILRGWDEDYCACCSVYWKRNKAQTRWGMIFFLLHPGCHEAAKKLKANQERRTHFCD